MKKALITLFALMMAFGAKAQEGEIIYKDYGPDGWSYEFDANVETIDTLQIDLDNEGIVDLYYHGSSSALMHAPMVAWVDITSKYGYNGFKWCCTYTWTSDEFGEPTIVINGTLGDTISNATSWFTQYFFNCGYYEGNVDLPNARYKGFRFPHESGGYCYGWLEDSIQYIRYQDPPSSATWDYHHNALVHVYRWAYCTIPNYPLRLGQTSFDWDVAENEANYFASIHPNPTTGQVIITGKDLKRAEVFNALGQCVATAQGEGERMTVDIGAFPAGIYFVNVTDEGGRKCVKKVIKK